MSRKRNNRDIADSDEENAQDDSNSSKRLRHAATQDSLLDDGLENGMDLDQDEEDQLYDASQLLKPKTNPKSQVKAKKQNAQNGHEEQEEEEVESDDDEIDEENDELNSDEEEIREEIEATRKLEGAVAESGVIEKVELTNFMCHKRQTVKFGPQLNFLIGHNGSGKSAFLTAITVALGGKASSTSRGQSFRAFVREGCTSAEVILTLKNRGEEAYKHDLYGDKIIIERRINSEGGGSWKIKSAEGKTISTKKEELNALTDHCNIQVDNPLNVLSQDAARSFLSSSKADDKYKFFLTGTQLTQLANEYSVIQDVIRKIDSSLAQQEQALPELEEKKQEQLAKYKSAEKAREQQKRLEIINKLIVWSQVEGKEKELRKLITTNEQSKNKLQKHRDELAIAEEQLRIAEDQIQEKENLRDGAADRTRPLESQRQQLMQQLKQISLKEKNITEEERTTNEQYNTLKGNITDLESQIEEETRKKIEGDRQKQERRDRYEDQRNRLTSEISTLKVEFAEVADQIKSRGLELDEVKVREGNANRTLEQVRSQLAQQQSIYEQLKGASYNQFSLYGNNMIHLVQAIKNENRWQQKPIGPIGTFVKIKNEQWSKVVENVLGKTLNAFCVTNHRDRALLQQLIRKTNNTRNTSIITAGRDLFDYSSGEPDESITTILRVLEIKDEYIKRQLITSSHIESNALIDTRAAATELLRRNTRNVKRCYTKDNLMVMGGSDSTSTSTLTEYRGPSRISRDTSAQMNECKHRIETLEKEVQAAGAEARRIQMERQGLERALGQHQQRHPAIQKQMRALQKECGDLEDDMHEDVPETTSALESAKRDAEEELRGLAAKFTSIQETKEKVLNEKEPLRAKIENLKQQIETIMGSFSDVATIIETAMTSRLTAISKRTHHQQKIDTFVPQIRSAEAAINSVEEDVATWTEEAMQYCEGERLKAEKSLQDYEREKAALEAAQKKNAKRGESDIKAIILEMQAAAKRYDDAKKEFDNMHSVSQALTRSLGIRLESWRMFRTLIAQRAKMLFIHHLTARGYSGKLTFDHQAQKLRLKVQTEDPKATQGKPKHARKDPTSLSGGEKSFSTICLLLSLWEAIGCPIRCLDEFDVFMDAVNRKIAMDMMIHNAKASNATQYILITPQGMQTHEGTEGVYITKMNDPVRNQATLN